VSSKPSVKPRARAAKRRSRATPLPAAAAHRSAATPWLRRFALGFLTLVAVSAACVLFWATRSGERGNQLVALNLSGEETDAEIVELFQEHGLVSSPRLFRVYFSVFGFGVRVASGPHVFRAGLSARELVQRLGRMPARPVLPVVLPEGLTFRQISERLEQREICSAAEFNRAVQDRALLSQLALTGPSAEGYLFPATYRLGVDSEPRAIVRQLVAEARKRLVRLDDRLQGAFVRLAEQRQWGEREVLTLASIVERETAAAEERPMIASVFFNRLDDPDFRPARMLQSDPTAAYGCAVLEPRPPSCEGYNGKVTREMVRDAGNPFNTYRHAGLPPGPIGNPGEDALLAVLSPAKTDYLYFVADGKGRHRFSRTFDEHRRAITEPTP